MADDGEAIAAWYVRVRGLLLSLAWRFRVPADDAEDLLHDVFVALICRSELVRDKRSWLIGAICHSARHYTRRERWSARQGDGAMPEFARKPDIEARLIVGQILARLLPRDAAVLDLRYVGGCSFREVGEIVHVSEKRAQRIAEKAIRRARRIAQREL